MISFQKKIGTMHLYLGISCMPFSQEIYQIIDSFFSLILKTLKIN